MPDDEDFKRGPGLRAKRKGEAAIAIVRKEIPSVGRYANRHYCPRCGRKTRDCTCPPDQEAA